MFIEIVIFMKLFFLHIFYFIVHAYLFFSLPLSCIDVNCTTSYCDWLIDPLLATMLVLWHIFFLCVCIIYCFIDTINYWMYRPFSPTSCFDRTPYWSQILSGTKINISASNNSDQQNGNPLHFPLICIDIRQRHGLYMFVLLSYISIEFLLFCGVSTF